MDNVEEILSQAKTVINRGIHDINAEQLQLKEK